MRRSLGSRNTLAGAFLQSAEIVNNIKRASKPTFVSALHLAPPSTSKQRRPCDWRLRHREQQQQQQQHEGFTIYRAHTSARSDHANHPSGWRLQQEPVAVAVAVAIGCRRSFTTTTVVLVYDERASLAPVDHHCLCVWLPTRAAQAAKAARAA